MKKYLLSIVLILSSYFSQAIPWFGELPGTTGCISYNAQTNKLILKITYAPVSDWANYVVGWNTWAYVQPSPSSPFIGPFPSISCSPTTCEYDISSLIGTLALPGCYDFFAVSDRFMTPGSIPPTNTHPHHPTAWNTSSGTWQVARPNGTWDRYWSACDCPEDSDPLEYVPCNALFDFKMIYNTTNPVLASDHYGSFIPHISIPDATYTYNYGNGTITSSPTTENYAPGNYHVCLTAHRITGEECESCMDICVSDASTILENSGSDPSSCNLNFNFIAYYTPNPSPFLAPILSGEFSLSSPPSGSSYLYDFGDFTTSTVPITHTYSAPGTYQVCITETKTHPTTICKTCIDICIGDSYLSPFAKKTDEKSVVSSKGNDQVSIFPNPASSKTELKIGMSKQDNVSIQIVDMTGKKVADVFNGTMNEGSQTLTINTENLASGLYQVKMMIGNKVTTQKLSVVK